MAERESVVNRFQVFLAGLALELESHDVKIIKSLLADNPLFERIDYKERYSGIDLFAVLQEYRLLSENNRDLLVEILTVAGRVDLAKRVKDFQKTVTQLKDTPQSQMNLLPGDVLQTSEGKTRFPKLARLLVCGGTAVMRELFDSIIPPANLATVLATPPVRTRLEQMKNKRLLTFTQWQKLYPTGSTCVESTSFDINLLFKLLRENVISGLSPPATGWDKPPIISDLSLPADMARIKYYRNAIAYWDEKMELKEPEFTDYWNEFKDALLRIVGYYATSGSTRVRDWEQAIDKLLTAPLEEAAVNVVDTNVYHDRTPSVDETTPPEILARGSKALRAYQMALKSGKTKNLRVPLMLIGQSRAGKTSLLRSLKCEKFNPEEDSTEGVQLHRSISKAEENTWREDKSPANSFDDCAARAIAQNLTASMDGQKFPTEEDDEESQNLVSEGDSHQDKDVSLLDKKEVDISKSKTLDNLLQSGANEPSSQLPEEVSEKASYMLQNPKAMDDGSIHLMTMDFAGQPVYQVTHPVFLSPRGIYILVHSLKNDVHVQAKPMVKKGSVREVHDECPMTNMDHLKSWLSYVALNATTGTLVDKPLQELNLPRKFPPVFLVCTHADKAFGNRKPEEMSLEILDHLEREENPAGDHLVHDIYAVNNTVSGSSEKENEDVIKLRKDIRIAAEHLPQINEDIPIRWLKFEKELKKLVENEQKRYLSVEEARNIASKCQVDLNSDECDTILNYLHDLKVIIYFEDIKMVIIDTQWLLDMFVKVITVQPLLKWKRGFKDCWRKLEEKGILDRALLEHLWSNLTDEQNTIDVLLTIMEKFSLLCRWKSLDGSDVFLVPAMLVNSNTKCDDLLSDQTLSPLVIEFESAHLSLGIFPRLLVAIAEMCTKEWPNSKLPNVFHNFCRFYDVGGKNGDFDLVVRSDIRSITVGIIEVKKDNRDPDLLLNVCQWIFGFVRKVLNEMRLNFPWMKNMDFEFGIRCPICRKSTRPCKTHNVSECIHDSCLHFVPGKQLPRCYKDSTSAKTMIKEEAYCCWFPKNTEDDQAGICDKFKKLEVTSSITVPEGNPNKDIVKISGVEVSLKDVDAQLFARELAAGLKLDRLSTDDPPEKTVKGCRELCNLLKKTYGRVDFIKELRKTLPSGMTGPLKKEDIPVAHLIGELEDLTRSLCSDDLLQRFAGHLNIRRCHIDSYKTSKGNPAENILENVCRKRRLTIGDLYDILCKCEANSLADEFL